MFKSVPGIRNQKLQVTRENLKVATKEVSLRRLRTNKIIILVRKAARPHACQKERQKITEGLEVKVVLVLGGKRSPPKSYLTDLNRVRFFRKARLYI